MRIVYSDDYNYSLGVVPPGIENIENNIQTAVLNELMLVIDYSCVID